MSDDKHARNLINRATRLRIYRQLNPCNTEIADNCPEAAAALFAYLWSGARNMTSIVPAACVEPGHHMDDGPGVSFRRAGLGTIINLVDRGAPGNVVVVRGQRPRSSDLAPEHYFCLVKLGAPQNDVFWADCSRPDWAMFYPSRFATPPGNWLNTIQSMVTRNHLRSFSYTRGPFTRVVP